MPHSFAPFRYSEMCVRHLLFTVLSSVLLSIVVTDTDSNVEDAAEAEIRAAFERGDLAAVATLTIERYGPELFGFLAASLRDVNDAEEVFSRFAEAFWLSLPRFGWRCSARTWAYKIARRAAGHYRRAERYPGRAVPLSQASGLSNAVARVRTITAAHQQTAVKDRFQQLRESLPEEDQSVLVLRVDRGLSWLELAEVMLEEDGAATSGEDLAREAQRLRKRYQLAKERLRQLARAEGLIPE
jgi:RNA polymerase sigma-70 factor, ECF subfamily